MSAATKARPPSAAAIRRKQADCMHPARNVHPTFDDRWEVCDLCGIIRPSGTAAPWVIAYDLAQPEPPVPPIFQGLQPDADATTAKQPTTTTRRRRPLTIADFELRDEELLGASEPWQHRSPPLDPAHSRACPRCDGTGTAASIPHRWSDSETTSTHYEPTPAPFSCPRCQGTGSIATYIAP